MKKTLAILLASAALATAVGVPALAAIASPDRWNAGVLSLARQQTTGAESVMRLADSDEDHDGHGYGWQGDDDDDRYGDSEECDDDDSHDDAAALCAPGNNPAPAGTMAPPQNGLFTGGAAPTVQVN